MKNDNTMNIPAKSPVRIDQDFWAWSSVTSKRELVGTVLAIPLSEVGTRGVRIVEQGRVGGELIVQLEYTDQ